MRKAGVLSILFVVVLLAFAVVAEAQQLKKVPRIGYLSAFDPAFESARAEAIRLALHERGYIEGQNIGIEYRYAEGKIDRFPELAAELVHLKVDLIVVAGGDRLVRTAKNATKTIPIVMLGLGSDPIKAGLVESLEKQIVDFALKSRLPSVYSYRAGVDAGGFMYYGADLADSYRRVAYYVDRILKGAKPAELPVKQPKKFELIINLKTAKQIGITIPPNVLVRADRVIK